MGLAVIPIFDILNGFGVLTERLNPIMSEFLGCFSTLLTPQTKIQKSSSANSNDYGFGGFAKIWLKSVGQIRRIVAEKWRNCRQT